MVVTCVVEYARGCGYITMQEICCRMESQYQVMVEDQDTIGWRRFMEGMLSWCLVGLQPTLMQRQEKACSRSPGQVR
jgi:hypothetical protein